jgi:hypothetical protein
MARQFAVLLRTMVMLMKITAKGLGYLCLALFGGLFLLVGLAFEHRTPTRL